MAPPGDRMAHCGVKVGRECALGSQEKCGDTNAKLKITQTKPSTGDDYIWWSPNNIMYDSHLSWTPFRGHPSIPRARKYIAIAMTTPGTTHTTTALTSRSSSSRGLAQPTRPSHRQPPVTGSSTRTTQWPVLTLEHRPLAARLLPVLPSIRHMRSQ